MIESKCSECGGDVLLPDPPEAVLTFDQRMQSETGLGRTLRREEPVMIDDHTEGVCSCSARCTAHTPPSDWTARCTCAPHHHPPEDAGR